MLIFQKWVFVFWAVLSGSFICTAQSSQPVKHALLIGISKYQSDGYAELSSDRDIALMTETLKKQGFADKNIHPLLNKDATLAGIKNAFAKLIAAVNPGDIVVVHFSCHGRQVMAQSFTKLSGIDECAVPYDAPFSVDVDDEKELAKAIPMFLRGYELGNLLKNTRARLGAKGDLAVFLDFCYSGSASRGETTVRGGAPALVPSKKFTNTMRRADSTQWLSEIQNTSDAKALSPFVVISATKPDEQDAQAYDTTLKAQIGSLTDAVARAFSQLSPNTTYREFFASIQNRMYTTVPDQHPMIEGDGQNRQLLGGDFVVQKPYIEIESILPGKKTVRLKAGTLMGLGIGSKLAIYPAGTNDPSKQKELTRGVITKAQSFYSELTLDAPVTFDNPVNGWAFIREQSFGNEAVVLGFNTQNNSSYSENEKQWVKQQMAGWNKISFASKPELLLAKGVGSDTLYFASNGMGFGSFANADDQYAEGLKKIVTQYLQYKLLKQLKAKEEGIAVEVKLVPVFNGKADTSYIRKRMVNGTLALQEGDTICLQISNKGTKRAFIHILDLQPDGVINAILPNSKKNIGAGNQYVDPGTQRLFNDYQVKINPPYGTELFKVIATDEPLEYLETLVTNKDKNVLSSRGSDGKLNTLFELLKNSYGGNSRGDVDYTASGTTSDILFRITKRKL